MKLKSVEFEEKESGWNRRVQNYKLYFKTVCRFPNFISICETIKTVRSQRYLYLNDFIRGWNPSLALRFLLVTVLLDIAYT